MNRSLTNCRQTCSPDTLRNRVRRTAMAVAFAAAGVLLLAPATGRAQSLPLLDAVTVTGMVEGEVGYRATRSSSFTKTETPLKEVPASVTVVPAELMKDQAMQGMADVFRYVPGVIAHQGESNRDQLILRGNNTSSDFYVDGIRDDAQVFRDLYNLDLVEVLKGPAGMVFGRGGAGGIVNRVTKIPVFHSVREASLTAGSHEQYRATLDLADRVHDTAAWRLNLMTESAGGFRDGVNLRRSAINPTVSMVPDGRSLLTIGYEHLDDRRTPDRGNPSSGGRPYLASRSQFFGDPTQSEARSRVDGLYAIYSRELGGIRLRNTSRVTHYDKAYQNVYPGSAVTPAGTLTISAYSNANRRTNVFNQTDLTSTFQLVGHEHRLLAGLEFGHQDSSIVRRDGVFGAATFLNLAGVPALHPRASVSRFDFNPGGSNPVNNVRATTLAVYLQDQIRLSDAWKLLVGVRYDRFSTVFRDQRTVTGATPLANLSRVDTAFSPRLGVIFTPSEGQGYYASYSYSFLPSGETLGLAVTTVNLAPEQSRNYEIGGRWDVLPAMTLSAAAFRTDKTDVRVADPVNLGTFLKSGRQRVTGAELALTGQVTRRWQVYGGYSGLDARILSALNTGTTATVASTIPAGRKLPLVPGHALSLWNKIELRSGLATALGVVHQSRSFATISNAVELPAFTRFDLALYYSFAAGRLRLALNVENLAGDTYFPTADGDNNITVGAPRTARLTLRAKL